MSPSEADSKVSISGEDLKRLDTIKKAENQRSQKDTLHFVLEQYVKLKQRLSNRNTVVSETETEVLTKKDVGLQPIITRFHGKCTECGCDVPRGSFAYWGPDVLVCLDCAVDIKSDHALMNRYLKVRELDKIHRMLKEQSNKYADQINELKYGVRFQELVVKFDEMLGLNTEYLQTLPGEKDPLVLKLRKICEEAPRELEELKVAVTSKFAPIKRKKKLRKYA